MISETSDRHPVDQLAEEFVARYRAGERPSISEYAQKYPELANELQELLTALVLIEEHGPAESASDDDDASGDAATKHRIPDQLGEYRILRELGRGGMGVVYEAVQESLGRHVALKVLPVATLMDATRLKRFQREVHAAAKLHHTNIVPVFGVGESDGIRYYAMQFIQGQSLDAVLDELRAREADTDARSETPQTATGAQAAPIEPTPGAAAATSSTAKHGLTSDVAASGKSKHQYYRSIAQIGVQVAEALGYAHQQGIEHRDVKPSNLLLDLQGTVWVTDFGLAKCAGMEELTHTGDIVGTLRYVAPERLQGEGDARADTYSLGLTLYELLTLRPAFEASARAALVRQIAQDNPPRPRKLDPRIPRDLETIVLKACAKEPSRRYATANELAEDLRRFQGDRPIEARRTPWWEHAWRWSRRNPGIAGASAAAVAALLIGLGVALWQWQRADRNYHQAEKDFELAFQAIDQMLERVGGERLLDVPHLDPTRQELLQDALRFYDRLLKGSDDNPRVRFATARAYCRLGQIHRWLGDPKQAIQSFDQAIALLQVLLASDPGHVELRQLAAMSYCYRGAAKELLDELPDAEADYRQALAGYGSLSAEQPGLSEFALGRAMVLIQLGTLLRSTPRLHEAESLARQVIVLAEGLPSTNRYRSQMLASGFNLLNLVLEGSRDPAVREREHLRVVELRERAAREDPGPSRQGELAAALNNLARCKAMDHRMRGEAERLYRRALEIAERLVADFPGVPVYQSSLANTANGCGLVLRQLDRPSEAETMLERSVALWKNLVAKTPEKASYRVSLGVGLNNLAQHRHAQGNLADSRVLLEEAIDLQETVVNVNAHEASALEFLAKHHRELADMLVKSGNVPEAEKAAFRMQELAQQLAKRHEESELVRAFQARAYENLAYVRRNAGQAEGAADALADAAGHWRRLVADFPFNPDHASRLGVVLDDCAVVRSRQRRWADMMPLLEEAIRVQEAAIRSRPNDQSYQRSLCNHYSNDAESRIVLGDHGHVPLVIADIRKRFPLHFDDYLWAGRLALCIPLAQQDVKLAQADRDRLAREYADGSMVLLQAAHEKKSKDLPQIHTHAAFTPLRDRPDFQELLAKVARPAK